MSPSTAPRFVAYYRVSTARQGQSGLGLEAQRSAVLGHVQAKRGEVVGAYTEIESGKRKDRPELAKALAAAKRYKATLIVAKLDRLARNVAFLSAMMEAGVEFVAVDMPEANRFFVHILAAVAENEAKLISDRSKAALQARKARGLPLGNPANLNRGNSTAPKINRAKARAFAERMRPVVESMFRTKASSIRTLTRALNEAGHVTVSGGIWHPTSVARLCSRLNLP